MSFMFHPYPYKDLHAVNPVTPRDTVVEGVLPVARRIAALFAEGCRSAGLDGYAGTEFDVLYQLLAAQLLPQGVRIIRTEELLLPPETIREMLRDSLPEDRSLDPVLLYGVRMPRRYEDFFRTEALDALREALQGEEKLLVLGRGALCQTLRGAYDTHIWVDITPAPRR